MTNDTDPMFENFKNHDFAAARPVAEIPALTRLHAEAKVRERQARGDVAGFDAWMAASPDVAPMAGDEIEAD
jgi:hypothetical protein